MNVDSSQLHAQVEALGTARKNKLEVIELAHILIDQVGVDPLSLSQNLAGRKLFPGHEQTMFTNAAELISLVCGSLNYRLDS